MKKISCSCTQDKGNLNHNYLLTYRKNLKHVHHELTPDNIIFKSTTKTQIEREFNSIFDEDVNEYNLNQPREDRKIKNYYQNCLKNQKIKEPWREIIYQIGNKEDAQDPELRTKMKNCLTKFYNEFEKNYPQFRVAGAVIHMDEATPHLHIDYVPVAERNPNGRGLAHKVNLEESCRQMGFDKEFSLINKKEKTKPLYFNGFRNHSMKLLEDIMQEEGLERKIIGDKSEHLSVSEFKKEQDAINKYINENRDEVEDKATKRVLEQDEKYKEIKAESQELNKTISQQEADLQEAQKLTLQQLDDYMEANKDVKQKKQELEEAEEKVKIQKVEFDKYSAKIEAKKQEFEELEPQWQEQKKKALEIEKKKLQKKAEKQEAVRQQELLEKQKEFTIATHSLKTNEYITKEDRDQIISLAEDGYVNKRELQDKDKAIKQLKRENKTLLKQNNILTKIVNFVSQFLPSFVQDKIDNWIGESNRIPTEEEINNDINNYVEEEEEEE